MKSAQLRPDPKALIMAASVRLGASFEALAGASRAIEKPITTTVTVQLTRRACAMDRAVTFESTNVIAPSTVMKAAFLRMNVSMLKRHSPVSNH